MRAIIFFTLLTSLVSCNSSRPIVYQYVPKVNDALLETLSNLNKSNFSIKDGKKSKRAFALVNDLDYTTIIVFNFTENMPPKVKALIKRSNRFILIGNRRIPVIFYFDNGNSFIRESGVNLGLIGGVLIQFNESGEVLASGPVH